MKATELLKKIETSLLMFLLFVVPVFVVSFLANAINTPKLALLVFTLSLILISKGLRALIDNKISFSSSRYDIPVFLIVLVYLISAVTESPNKMDAFFLPGNATIVVGAAMLYFLVNQLSTKQKQIASRVLFLSGVFYSLIVLLVLAGVFNAIPQLPAFVRNSNFDPTGSQLAGLLYLIALSPIGMFAAIKEEKVQNKAFLGVSLTLIVFAALINIYRVFPGMPNSPRLPSFDVSWKIAIDALKVNPLFGMGPGNYLSAFSQFLPIEYNQTDIWAVRFTSGRSFAFTAVTEVGIAGMAAFATLLLAIFKKIQEKKLEDPNVLSLGIIVVLLLLFPASPVLLIFMFSMLAISSVSDSNVDMLNFEGNNNSRLPVLVATVPMFVATGVIVFYSSTVLAADYQYKKALNSIAENNGGQAYELLQSAITANPLVDRYRVSYAQINLALANSIAANEELTDQDRQTVAQLIQQAIREGKNAVALNPAKASNWEILGSIYRQVAPLAEGAANFSAQTYSQAIALDPMNPSIRISLGGIFYSAGQYENAIDTFTLAARVKSDHANAYYNLAVAYRENNQIDQAIAAMSQVLALVDRDSNDFEVAKTALEELQERRSNANIPSTETLQVEETGDPSDTQIELNDEAAPPDPEPVEAEETDVEIEPTPLP